MTKLSLTISLLVAHHSLKGSPLRVRRLLPAATWGDGFPERLRPLPLRVNFAWTFAGNVVYAACQWGMMMALAKIGSPEMVGRFALGLAITAPVMLFASLALRAAQATDARGEYHFADYLALRLVTTFLALIVIAGIVLVGGYTGETGWVILLIGLAKAFEAISDVFYGLFQRAERMDRIAWSMIIKGVVSLTALTIAVWILRSVWAGAAALAAAWALVLALYDIPIGSSLVSRSTSQRSGLLPIWHWPTLFRLARLTFPLGVTMMLISLNTNIPRYFVQHYWGERELGFFAAAAYLIVAGTTVVSALGQSASPRLAHYYAMGETTRFRTLLVKLLGVGALLGLSGIVISLVSGRQILTILYTSAYAMMADVFAWIMVAAAMAYLASFLGYALTATRHFAIQPFIFGGVALVNGLLCLVLIPRYGLTGAAWAMGLANLVQFIVFGGCVLYALQVSSRPDTEGQGVIFYGLER